MKKEQKETILFIWIITWAVVMSSIGATALGKGKQHQIQFSEIIDLSHVISQNIPLWPGDPAVEFETVATFSQNGYFLRKLSIGEHSATHMNAPNSFHAAGNGIDSYSPGSLVKKAVVIDVSQQVARNADYVVSLQDVAQWEKTHGRIPPDTMVLVYTGWDTRWNDPKAFINADSKGKLHFPGISGETSNFLLKHRDIAGVGIDTHGVDPGLDERFATNTQVLAEDKIILECLTNLDQLPAKETTLVIGILRLQNGSGSPVSVLAFKP